MKKIYSIVLMATMLLVGANVWADDISVVNHTKGTSQTFNDLQAAVDFVGAGDSATITLLNSITLDVPVVIPHVTGTISQDNPNVLNRLPQKITLDLGNNHNITGGTYMKNASFSVAPKTRNIAHAYGCIQLVKGNLHIIGAGKIERGQGRGENNPNKSAITVYGADWEHKSQVWSVLTIGENVTLSSNTAVEVEDSKAQENKAFGLCIQEFSALPYGYNSTLLGYTTSITGQASAPTDKCSTLASGKYRSACAYGVKVFIKGKIFGYYRGVNVVGTINAAPQCDIAENATRTLPNYPYYQYYYPYVKIDPSAEIWCINDGIKADGNGGIYAGGYVVWDISGYVHGQTGILAKSGDFILKDAIVASDSQTEGANTGEYHKGETAGSGIFIASDAAYAGGTAVTLTGDTKVSGNGSAAITDVLAENAQGNSTVSHIAIESGTIEPGAGGAIILDSDDVEKTTVAGGNISGVITSTDEETGDPVVVTVVELTNDETTTVTTVTDENGKTTYVVGPGKATDIKESAVVYNAGKDSIRWTGTDETLQGDVTIDYLEINEMDGTDPMVQVLTIPTGKTLEVGRVILGYGAQIVVEAGAKFIVSGEKGIVAQSVDNIILKATPANPSIFLFDPKASSNRHPEATVEFVSRSYTKSSSNYAFQRFGIPTYLGQLKSINTQYNNSDVATGFMAYDYAADDWTAIGYINMAGKPALDLTKLSNPFEYYQMQHNAPEMGTVVTMKGALVGNEAPALNVRGEMWNGYANSFMGNMSIKALVDMIPNSVQRTIYLNNIQENQKVWIPYNKLSLGAKDMMILPMQPFLVRNINAAAEVAINYADAVYYPTTGKSKPSGAPARRGEILSDITIATIIVNGENTNDRVIVAEGAQFTTEFDNGYDASKYMNDGINMYVSAAEKMAIFATDNLENTYVGFQAVDGGIYTIEFANVDGAELTLIDLETGARVSMVEGNTYEFTAAANSVNDYRFEIIESAKLPTAIDNTEAVKSAKGIYTVTGQYLGEMNVWNTLPAGVYVINGEKRVK